MAWPKGVRAVKGPATFLSLMALALACGNTLGKEIVPVGPELAPREIGVLLKGYPILTQSNPNAPQGVGVMLWGCEYQVGRAVITTTITTQPGDPMPCKRKVAFGESPQKSAKEQ
ncbi:MAG TPA: hypothetical protein VHC91_22080 [Trinickia sp.]|uniref:hypothetical protein n=1 Tax=Trinickia sp. TaxID=2571163 RepID=UPI002D160E61|nr:hypothetical protein [Trinickia sp.]HVW53052.1 hypothetical protein [Trinickia sp.]